MLKLEHSEFMHQSGQYLVEGCLEPVTAKQAIAAIVAGKFVQPADARVARRIAEASTDAGLSRVLGRVFGFHAPSAGVGEVEPALDAVTPAHVPPIAPEDESARVHELLAAAGDSLPELKTLATQFGVEVSPRWSSKRIAGAITKSVSERLARDSK